MDEMIIEILPEGTIKTETNPISPANHSNAEDFMNQMAQLTGGQMSRQRRGHKHSHGHQHQHAEQRKG